jgi:hypothetical protein
MKIHGDMWEFATPRWGMLLGLAIFAILLLALAWRMVRP